ncbi:MAG TPA: DUF5947 family protein [Vicinamibacterales bacterium]|jgi:hypothetical protein|nr:DUF5947 family protein [Vicinamibacterales bacterium]
MDGPIATGRPSDALATLRRYAAPRPAVERCDLCSQPVAGEHQHLFEPPSRRVLCACDACAILFGGSDAKYTRIPRRVLSLPGAVISDGQWDALAIPIGMAFFTFSTPLGRMEAWYPGPAGAIESLLPLDTWNDIVRTCEPLARMERDVEALLVNRTGPSRGSVTPAQYLVPIDQCYRLVGLIRTHWKGFTGGAEVWSAIDGFFAELDRRADVYQ